MKQRKDQKEPIRIVLADDHPLFLDGLAFLLEDVPDIKIAGTAADGKEALKVLSENDVDILVTDIQMPGMDGAQLSEQIRRSHPQVKILVLSMHTDKGNISYLIHQGASGYLFKNSEQEVILEAIRTLADGGTYFPDDVKVNLFEPTDHSKDKEIYILLSKLSDREKEVLRLIAEEYTTQEIADKLYLSYRTVESHRQNLLRKLDVRNSVGLVKQAVKLGLVK